MGATAMRPMGSGFMQPAHPAPPMAMLPLATADQGLAFKASPRQTQGAFGAQVALTVLVSVALFMVFILAFFFLLTRNVEGRIVSTSVARVVNTLSDELRVLVLPAQAVQLGALIQRLQPPDTSAENEAVRVRNASLAKHAGIVVGVVAGVVIIIAVGVFMGMKSKQAVALAAARGGVVNYPNPVNVLLCATFGFAVVALCEVVFLYGVAGRYQPLDTAATRNDILDALISQLEAIPATAPK
jgi:hypothetical protein